MLTVLTVSSTTRRILITLLPARPLRLKAISIPSVRRKVWARRRRPASARICGPAGDQDTITGETDALTQQVGGAARPRAALGHDLAHAGRHRVCIDGIGDRSLAVYFVGPHEGPGRPECTLAGSGPEREVGHPGQPLEAHPG